MKGIINGEISKNDLISFMDKSNVEYSIPRGSYKYIFDNPYQASSILRAVNNGLLEDIYQDVFPNVTKALSNSITPSLVYDEGWRLEITTDSIINAIMYNFGSSYRTKDYEAKNFGNKNDNTKRVIKELGNMENRMYTLDTYHLHDSLSNEVLNAFSDKGKDYSNLREEVSGFLRTTRYLLSDNIFDDININVDKYLENTYKPKNLLYTLAVDSLLKMKKYKDEDYSLLPNTYYERVSKKGNSPFAKSTWIKGKRYFAYNDYNNLYNEVLEKYPELLKGKKSILDNIDILFDQFIFIPPGRKNRKDMLVKYIGSKKELMSADDFELLKDKINYFENTEYTHKMQGIDSLDGYLGYVYDNNYIIFEKFFRDKAKSKPASNEAIYVMPADKLLLSIKDKQSIMKYIKENPESGVTRIIHRGNNYKQKIDDIIDSPDISTESFISIHDRMKQNKKIMIKK